jgi:hypothetical protein
MDNKNIDQLNESQFDALMYTKAYVKNAWIIVCFSIVGWAIFFSGFNDSQIGLLLLGSAIFAAPTLWEFWHRGFSSFFGEVSVDASYQDEQGGAKRRKDSSPSLGVNLFMAFLIIVLGVFVTMLRYILIVVRYYAKNAKIPVENRLNFKEGILLPTAVGLGGFIAVILIIGSINGMVSFGA